MPSYYRFINSSERKRLWSILLCQITIVMISWYSLRKTPSNSECYGILGQNYSSASPLVVIPNECTFSIGFWLRVNHYTMYSVILLFANVSCGYEISSWNSFIYVFIWTGLMFNAGRMHNDHSIMNGDAPYLILVLIMVVYLEEKPFFDWEMARQCLNIENENDQRLFQLTRLNDQCSTEALNQLAQCNDTFDREGIFEQPDEQLKKNESNYRPLELPQRARLEQQKKNIFLQGFLLATLFLLFSLALWNYLPVFYKILFDDFDPRKTSWIGSQHLTRFLLDNSVRNSH